MAEPQRTVMTPEAFFRWQERQEAKYELVDGEAVLHRMMTGARQRHDAITTNALAAFHRQLRGRQCRAMTSDVAIAVPSGGLRRADAAVDCGPARDDAFIASQPTLVVEVLSVSTRVIDRFRKLEDYKSVPSLLYILLVEPGAPVVKLYARDGEAWRTEDVMGLEARVDFPALDLTLPLADLYEGLTFEA